MSLPIFAVLALLGSAPNLSASTAIEVGPLPEGSEILAAAHRVVRALDFDSIAYTRGNDDGAGPILVNRSGSGRPWINRFESHLRNRPGHGADLLVIYHSGTLKGTAVLVNRDDGPDAHHRITLWLPALRKTRRIARPDSSEGWTGSLFTYGEIMLGRPSDLRARIIGVRTLDRCLRSMQLANEQHDGTLRRLPQRSCDHRGKSVYEVVSTPVTPRWFDRQEALIGARDKAPYIVRYYLHGALVKTVETDWQPVAPGETALFPRYSYAYTPADARESLIYLPRASIAVNPDHPAAFWSERTLRRIRR
ncbi:MAG: outer membrane lipoprotein-sorting protein [Gammaproteobacteria bacterium]